MEKYFELYKNDARFKRFVDKEMNNCYHKKGELGDILKIKTVQLVGDHYLETKDDDFSPSSPSSFEEDKSC